MAHPPGPAGRVPWGNFELCCEEPGFVGGALSLFFDFQFHSAVGVVGIVVGLVLDVYLYSSFGVVGVGVVGPFFYGGVDDMDEP